MARVPVSHFDAKDPDNSRSYPGAQGSSTHSSSYSRDTLNNNSITEKVINSPAYKSAWQVLSQESDKSWLQRLEMIPYSVSNASNTFLDDWGLSNNFNDKQAANYQYCMEQITALMAEYQSWKNSLPTTQAQQMADAGINSAITGQGISTSQIPNVGVSTDPSKLPSTNVGQNVLQLGQFILSATTGFASVAKQFKELGLATRSQQFTEDSSFLDFIKYSREHGMDLFGNIEDWTSLVNNFKDLKLSDPEGDYIRATHILNKWLAHHKNAPIIGHLATLYPDLFPVIDMGSGPTTTTGVGATSVGVDAYAELLLDLHRNEEKIRLETAKFNKEVAENNAGISQHNVSRSEYEAKLAEYEKNKSELVAGFIKTLMESDNIYDKLLVIKYLMGTTSYEVKTLDMDSQLKEKEVNWYDAQMGAQIADDIIPF